MMLIFALEQVHGAIITELPFERREGLLWIEVQFAPSAERLNFLVDTGAGVSALNLSVAKRIGFRLGRKVSVQGVHTRLAGYWQENVSMKAGEVTLPSQCVAIDLTKLSRSCERPVDGLLGADFFRGRITEIDFVTSKIRLIDSIKASESDITLPLELRSSGMRVPVSVNGRSNQFVRVDTGCASALQWVRADVPDQSTKQVAIGLTEVAIPQTTTTLRLGACEFKETPTGLHKKAIFPGESGLLGNGVLSRFAAVTIDAKNGLLLLRK